MRHLLWLLAAIHNGRFLDRLRPEMTPVNRTTGPRTPGITIDRNPNQMACYIDHSAQGGKPAQCAKTCIESGLPVGIKYKDGKTVTVKGKGVSRDGINMIANAEIVK